MPMANHLVKRSIRAATEFAELLFPIYPVHYGVVMLSCININRESIKTVYKTQMTMSSAFFTYPKLNNYKYQEEFTHG